MSAQRPNLAALTRRFNESPTTSTLRAIMRSVEAYCLRTRYPKYNQAAIAATVFERVSSQKPLSPSILTAALKAEACWDAWSRH